MDLSGPKSEEPTSLKPSCRSCAARATGQWSVKDVTLRQPPRFFTLAIMIGLAMCIGCAAAPDIRRGPVVGKKLQDGMFEGYARKGPVKVAVEVYIENARIQSIRVLEHRTWKGRNAETVIAKRIIDAQSTEVDAVTGATTSSVAIMMATQSALDKATLRE